MRIIENRILEENFVVDKQRIRLMKTKHSIEFDSDSEDDLDLLEGHQELKGIFEEEEPEEIKIVKPVKKKQIKVNT